MNYFSSLLGWNKRRRIASSNQALQSETNRPLLRGSLLHSTQKSRLNLGGRKNSPLTHSDGDIELQRLPHYHLSSITSDSLSDEGPIADPWSPGMPSAQASPSPPSSSLPITPPSPSLESFNDSLDESCDGMCSEETASHWTGLISRPSSAIVAAVVHTLGILALAHRARLQPSEITNEVFLTLLWILLAWDSQYGASVDEIVYRFTHLHPERRAAGSKLCRDLLSLQVSLLKRCDWRVRLDEEADLGPAVAALNEIEPFSSWIAVIALEGRRIQLEQRRRQEKENQGMAAEEGPDWFQEFIVRESPLELALAITGQQSTGGRPFRPKRRSLGDGFSTPRPTHHLSRNRMAAATLAHRQQQQSFRGSSMEDQNPRYVVNSEHGRGILGKRQHS